MRLALQRGAFFRSIRLGESEVFLILISLVLILLVFLVLILLLFFVLVLLVPILVLVILLILVLLISHNLTLHTPERLVGEKHDTVSRRPYFYTVLTIYTDLCTGYLFLTIKYAFKAAFHCSADTKLTKKHNTFC